VTDGVNRKSSGKPGRVENLKPWKIGQSGNPGGRPKGLVSDATREWLKLIDRKTGKTNAELIAQAQGKRALKGETNAYCAMRDTSEGRPAQTQQHEIVSNDPVNIRVEAPDLIQALRNIYGLGGSPSQQSSVVELSEEGATQ
jgi:Family of unknown function (DUF5681)